MLFKTGMPACLKTGLRAAAAVTLAAGLFISPPGQGRADAYEESWDSIEARKSPIKCKRKVESKRIKSINKNYSIPFKVILPTDYEISDKRYGVVLMLCGASGARRGAGSEPLYFSVWCKLPRVMDNLAKQQLGKKDFEYAINDKELKWFNEKLAENPFEDFIAVDLWHPSSGRDLNYDKFITEELFAFLDENYRTIPSKDFRAIDGACGGGAVALITAFRNPECFAAAGGMQTDLGTFPYALKFFEENKERIRAAGLKFNLNTNKNDVCNSYYFHTKKDEAGNKIKVPDGELAKLTVMIEEIGLTAEVNVFSHCAHGYSAYRYPNGHQTMMFYSALFKENARKLKPEELKAAGVEPQEGRLSESAMKVTAINDRK